MSRLFISLQVTQAEVVVLVNQCPQSDVEFNVMIEECEERFTEDQVKKN